MSTPYYVENQWTCRACGAVVPGRELRCPTCGKPKEGVDAFDASGAASAAAVTDPALLALAGKGAHVLCSYCRYENRSDAVACARCGATMPGPGATPSGAPGVAASAPGAMPGLPPGPTVVPLDAAGGLPAPTVVPLHGGPSGPTPTVVAVGETKGRSLLSVIGVPLLLVSCLAAAAYAFWPRHGSAQVEAVRWQVRTLLEAQTQQTGEGFREALPAGAVVTACQPRVAGTVPCNPQPCVVAANGQCNPHECNCQNVCSDQGNGFSRCERVCGTCYDTCPVGQQTTCYQQCPRTVEYCRYTATVWSAVDTKVSTGTALPTQGTPLVAGPGQRVREEVEYTVDFVGQDGARHAYHPADGAAFARFAVGQRWHTRETAAGAFTPERLD